VEQHTCPASGFGTRRAKKLKRTSLLLQISIFVQGSREISVEASRSGTQARLSSREATTRYIGLHPDIPQCLPPTTKLRRHAVVVAQEAAQTLLTGDHPCTATDFHAGFDQAVRQTLMVAFPMKMQKIIANRLTQCVLTEEDHPFKAFFAQTSMKSLDMG